MSRAGSKRVGIAPTLFPFLAVMLCTIGALVLILILSVATAQSTVQEMVHEAEHHAQLEEATIQLVSRGLSEKLDEGRILIEKKRLVLQHLETHIRELIEELESLQRQNELAESAGDDRNETEEERSQWITELERQLADATEQLQKEIENPDSDKPIFAIIPYEGPNGTHRRPIYLECNARGVVIQPEGVVLSPKDLAPPYGPGNPLDAALRTIRSEFPSITGSVTSNPYPLLIVRPSGIGHYMMARAAMTGWDDQFGYELISEDMDLAFPTSLPQLAEKITQSLVLARERQAALVRAMPQYYDQQGLDNYSSIYDTPSRNGLPNRDDEMGFESTVESGESVALAGIATSYGPNDGPGDDQGGDGQGTKAISGPAGSAGIGSQSGLAHSFGGSMPSAGSEAGGGPGTRGSGTGGGLGGMGTGGLGTDGSGASPSNSFAPNDGLYSSGLEGRDIATMNADQPNYPGSLGGLRNTVSPAYPNSGHSNAASPMSSLMSSEYASGIGGELAAGSPSGLESGGLESGASPSASGVSASAAAGAAGGTASAASTNFSASNFSAGSPGSGGGLGQMSQDLSAGDPSDPNYAGGAPSLNMDFSNKPSEATRPVAASRGSNWAWERTRREQTSVVRAIRLQCFKDRWILLPEKGSHEKLAVIDMEGRPIERAGRLAIAIRHRVEGWGVALNGGHWTPVLQVDVAPDAEWRFQQLSHLMDGSGIEVQRNKTIGE